MKKKYFLVAMVTSFLFLPMTTSGAAITELRVLLGGDGVLYKQTCTGLNCSAWTAITGGLKREPTLIWDYSLGYYVMIGLGTDNKLYRSTFDINGNFNNDWTYMPGGTQFPVVTVAGIFRDYVWYKEMNFYQQDFPNACNHYMSLTLTPPADGIVYVETDVRLSFTYHSIVSEIADIFIRTSQSDCTGIATAELEIPAGQTTPSVPPYIRGGASFAVTGGLAYTFYLNGIKTSGYDLMEKILYANMRAVFYPN